MVIPVGKDAEENGYEYMCDRVTLLYSNEVLIFFFFLLFRATPTAYGGSQARGPIGAVANQPSPHHSNA